MRWNYDSGGRAVGMNGSLIKDMGAGRDEEECEGLYCGVNCYVSRLRVYLV